MEHRFFVAVHPKFWEPVEHHMVKSLQLKAGEMRTQTAVWPGSKDQVVFVVAP